MEQQPIPERAAEPGLAVQEERIEDLHRRIEAIEALDDAELGGFNRTDWLICIVGALVIPTLLLIWAGR